jgi:trimethylamine--corrinoid protein Co-methyltransferase
MHAEALAGVAIVQTFRAGARVLYGAFPTVMDMKTMEVATGCVEMGMMNTAAVQLAKRYNLPIYASGGLTEAKRPDIQAGFEKNFSNVTVAMMGADLIHLTAGLMDSAKAVSYEQLVIDNENAGMIHKILEGIEVNEDTLAFDVIRKVGPGGHYLIDEHTLNHLDELLYPELIDRCSFDIWKAKGRPNMFSRAQARVRSILEGNKEGLLAAEAVDAIADRLSVRSQDVGQP